MKPVILLRSTKELLSNGWRISWACLTFTPRPRRGHFSTTAPSGFGNALLSRHPILATSASLFPTEENEVQRGCLEATIDIGDDKPLRVCVTHLDHTSESIRVRQFEDFPGGIQDLASRVDVILGDFNCVHPEDYESRPVAFHRLSQHPIADHAANFPEGPQVVRVMEQTGFVDAFVHRNVLGVNTFIPADEAVRYDYVWVSQDRIHQLADVGVIEEPEGEEASDHCPVWIELTSTRG